MTGYIVMIGKVRNQGTHWMEEETGYNVLFEGKMRETQSSQIISTQLQQIAKQAIDDPSQVFTSLAHQMDFDFLREAYKRLCKDGAPGLSERTTKDYKKALEENLTDLHQRLKE